MAGTNVFSKVGNLMPDRNLFNLSHSVSFDARFGDLIPVLCKQVVPGDVIKMGIECVIRLQPTFVPFNHEIDVFFYNFFVPHRLLDKKSDPGRFESVISGGLRGTETRDFYRIGDISSSSSSAVANLFVKHGFFDYAGIVPPDIVFTSASVPTTFGSWILARLLAYPWFAYKKIYLDYFADENLEDDKFIFSGLFDGGDAWIHSADVGSLLLKGNWTKDYFSSALPFQQRGTAPALPISGVLPVDFAVPFVVGDGSSPSGVFRFDFGSTYGLHIMRAEGDGSDRPPIHANSLDTIVPDGTNVPVNGFQGTVESGASVDLENGVTFDISYLRYAFQVQKFLERNARAGVRYTEFLKSHFGVSPTDSRLDRAEYLGGTRGSVVVSEVLQTSEGTASELGNYAGHGLVAIQDMCIDAYHVEEYGTLMTLMLIKPKAGYMQGVPREWMYGDRYEWYFPEFAHLSEQAIRVSELYVDSNVTDDTGDDIFGYQGIYDELRTAYDRASGDMRDSLDYWHLIRKFSDVPQLSETFIKVDPISSDLNRIFNYEGTSEIGAYPFICKVGFNLSMLRPMPFIPEPGLVDHF